MGTAWKMLGREAVDVNLVPSQTMLWYKELLEHNQSEEKAQRVRIIRNTLGPPVKAKAQKAQITRDWASYCKSREATPQIIRNSFGASVKATAEKSKSPEIDWDWLLQINESTNTKNLIIRNRLRVSMNAKAPKKN